MVVNTNLRDGYTVQLIGFPLAPRIPKRTQLLKGYGNSIVPQLAAEFIKASQK